MTQVAYFTINTWFFHGNISKNKAIMSSTIATNATFAAAPAKGFWMTHHNFGRHPFAAPGQTKRPSSDKSALESFKGFFKKHHNFGRHPFDVKNI